MTTIEIIVKKQVELKICPWCRKEELGVGNLQVPPEPGDDRSTVRCLTCGAEGPVGHDVEEAASLWNAYRFNKAESKKSIESGHMEEPDES